MSVNTSVSVEVDGTLLVVLPEPEKSPLLPVKAGADAVEFVAVSGEPSITDVEELFTIDEGETDVVSTLGWLEKLTEP